LPASRISVIAVMTGVVRPLGDRLVCLGAERVAEAVFAAHRFDQSPATKSSGAIQHREGV